MLKSLGLWKNKLGSGHETSIYVTDEKEPMNTEKERVISPIEPGPDGDQDPNSVLSSSESGNACVPPWDSWQLQSGLSYGPTIFKLW